MATYNAIRITLTADTEIASTLSGVTTPSTGTNGTTYDFVSLKVDDTNDKITGVQADGTVIDFEVAQSVTIGWKP